MEEYQIISSKLKAEKFNFMENDVESIQINHYPWDVNGYKPEADCKIVCCSDGLKVRMEAYEKEIKATYTEMNDPVYKDSCLEFFVSPFQNNPEYYFNFELNALGTLLLSHGKGREGRVRKKIENFKHLFQINSEIHQDRGKIASWSVEFSIPFAFLIEHAPAANDQIGPQMKANFYKCGDETKYPHYGCWNHIDLKEPNFHAPQFFGSLILRDSNH